MAGSTVYVGWKKDIYPSSEFLRKAAEKGELYYAEDGEGIAAAMVFNHDCNEGYEAFPWQTEAERTEIMVIHALGVHPRCSRRGYAKAMLREAIALAEKNGMKAIRLDVLEGNFPAEKLYAGFGFQYRGTVLMYYEDTGWKNFLLYELPLPAGHSAHAEDLRTGSSCAIGEI